MKKARPFIPYFFIAVLAVVFIRFQRSPHPVPMPEGSTIYDTAVMMLREFVRDGQDTNLGFSDIDEVDLAWIDTTRGINMYYLREDSLLRSGMPMDSHLIDLHRRIYPIYVGNSLRSAVTFQRTSFGWQPVSFDDSNIIATAINSLPNQPDPDGELPLIIIEAPFVQTQLVRKKDSSGTHFIASLELERVMGKSLPLTEIGAPKKHHKERSFLSGLKKYSSQVNATIELNLK
jgi:hypothetical protein